MKRFAAFFLAALLFALSACGAAEAELPEAEAPSASAQMTAEAEGEYRLAVTRAELPGGLASLTSVCAAGEGFYLAGTDNDGSPLLGLWTGADFSPLALPEGVTEIEGVAFDDTLSVLVRAGEAIQLLRFEGAEASVTELGGDLSALGRKLLYAEYGGAAYVLDSNTISEVRGGELTRSMESPAAYKLYTAVQAARDGLYVVESDIFGGTSTLFRLDPDIFTLEPVDAGGAGISGLGISPGGGLLMSCSLDGREFVQELAGGELFDWSEPGVVSPGYTHIFGRGDGSYLLFCPGQTSLELLEEKLLPPRTTLTLLTDLPRAELYTIVNDFNRTSEEYRIEVLQFGEDGLTAELLRTQLTAGEGPDIFAFYDRGSLAELNANALEDLLACLDADAEYGREALIPELLEAMCVQGKLSWLPYSFAISTFTAPTAYLSEPGYGFDEAQQAAAKAGLPLFPGWMTRDILWGWLSAFAAGQYMDVKAGTCSFDSPDYISLLEECAAAAPEFGSDSAALYNGLLQFETLQGLMRVSVISSSYGGAYAFVGAPNETTNGSMFSPDLCFAISSASENRAAAWQFVRSCLSAEHQRLATGAFPSTAAALDELIDDAMENGIWVTDEISYELGAADAEKLRELIASTETVQDAYPVVLDIMAEDAAQFFSGQITAQQAAAYTQNRVQLYLSERYG